MAIKNRTMNNWFYGAVGNRLTAQRTSEIYNSSAKGIENMLITDLGTLKVAKQFKKVSISLLGGIKKCLKTSEGYYLTLTTTNLYLMKKDDNSIVKTVEHHLQDTVDMALASRNILVLYDKVSPIKRFTLTKTDIIEESITRIFNPIKDKKEVHLDLWKVSKDPINTKKLRVVKMTPSVGIEEPIIKIKDNTVYLSNSDIVINRIYTNYNSAVDIDYFNNAKDGEIYGILKKYYEADTENSYLVGNENVVLGALTADTKYGGKYFTQITGNNTDGIFSFGNLIHISSPDKVGFHQDRLIFYKDGYIYFSKVRDYFNFRNDNDESDDPFYIQLAPINNRRGELKDLISSDGLYVISDVGIYVLGYGSFRLTPKNVGAGTYIASDMSVGDEYEIVGSVLYFLNDKGALKATSLDRASQQIAFSVFTVDKYSIDQKYKYLSKVTIEDKNYLIAFNGKDNKMFLFYPVNNEGIFRKSHLVFDGEQEKLFSIDDKLITDTYVYSEGDNNYSTARVTVNPIALNGNSILCDNSSSIISVATKFINEDRKSIKGIKINKINISNIGRNIPDLYSIYKIKCKFNMENGFDVDIFCNENEYIAELQAIQLDYNVVEDK